MLSAAEVLKVVEREGPLLPIQVKKALGGETWTIGAILSELAASKKVRISQLKIGGSPLYFLESQKELLQRFADYLKGPERKAFELLRERKVLRDSSLEPAVRVALRNVKDFAKPLRVAAKEGEELFWKWYLCSNEEAEELIRKVLGMPGGGRSAAKISGKKSVGKERFFIQKKLKTGAPPLKDSFQEEVEGFLKGKGAEVLEERVVRRGSELELVVKVPTSIGSQTYYCKAKNKKKCNEGDLSAAYLQGSTRKLPVLFLCTGQLTKKAEELLRTEFKGMIVKFISEDG